MTTIYYVFITSSLEQRIYWIFPEGWPFKFISTAGSYFFIFISTRLISIYKNHKNQKEQVKSREKARKSDIFIFADSSKFNPFYGVFLEAGERKGTWKKIFE